MKIRVLTDTGTEYMATVDKTVKLTPHFKLEELANNKGKTSLPMWEDSPQSRLFLVMLEEFRNWYGAPISPSSGYRQPEWNKKVGGDSHSAHLIGCAVDWPVKHNDSQRFNVKTKWHKICVDHGVVGAINLYTSGYHLEAFSDICYNAKAFVVRDYRGTKKDW